MKNLKFCFPILFFIGVFIFSNCKKNEEEPSNPYIGCCETQPIIDSVGVTKFYIPSIFTPNNDGINDDFRIYSHIKNDSIGNITTVKEFLLFDKESNLVFQKDTIDSLFENGVIKSIGIKPNLELIGLFSYSLTLVNSLGESKKIESAICIMPCSKGDMNEEVLVVNFLDCGYGTQYSNIGLDLEESRSKMLANKKEAPLDASQFQFKFPNLSKKSNS